MKKKHLILGLTVVLGSSIMTAQAGTTHSLGGHSMVNARNYSATYNLGGHHFTGQRESLKSKSLEKMARHIKIHGGTVNINRNENGETTINVTTGRGGTFSSSIHQLGEHNSGETKYAYSTAINSAKGKSYLGAGEANIQKDQNDNISSFETSHNGTINGKINVSATSTLNLTKDSNSFVHNNYIADSTWKNFHSSSTTLMKDENGKMINHSESVDLTSSKGNNLKTYTETTINKAIDSDIEVTHPNADSQYISINDHSIIPHIGPKKPHA